MESLFRTHAYLIAHSNSAVHRKLMDEIDWSDRLIGIKGARGVGKTTFLLQYAKRYGTDHKCLYINMNNLYFSRHSIAEFVKEFEQHGGKVLLIDQVFKHPKWSKELRECYDRFPNIKIVFAGSSVMRLKEENSDLNGIAKSYNLSGFSFREFLNLKTEAKIEPYSLQDILNNHIEIAQSITQKIRPMEYFQEYIHHGYYPFFLEKRNYSENLLKTMNMMIEVDILLIKQIELKYITKIKELFYLLAAETGKAPNVSQLAIDIHTSRATVMNYIKYLADARLINMVYAQGEEFPKKPAAVLLHNSNLMYTIYPNSYTKTNILTTFFINTLWKDHIVNSANRSHSFLVDNKYSFKFCCEGTRNKIRPDMYYVKDDIEKGDNRFIPLWMFGLLY